MSHSVRGPAGMSLRTLLAALVLAGLGLWQAWQCTDGMMASPMAATTMSTAMAHPDHVSPQMTGVAEPYDEPGMPGGMAGLCISVLASLAAAMWLARSPLKLLALLRRMLAAVMSPVSLPVLQGPALAQLCVSRT